MNAPELRETSEDGPPNDNAGQDSALSDPVSKSSSRDLKDSVRQYKSTQDPPPPFRRDVQFVLNSRTSDGNTDAVEKRDNRERN